MRGRGVLFTPLIKASDLRVRGPLHADDRTCLFAMDNSGVADRSLMPHFVSLPPPEAFDAMADQQNASKRWKTWAMRFDDFIEASGVTAESQRCKLLAYTAGKEVSQIIRDLSTKPDTLAKTIEAIQKHFDDRKSIVYARYQFRNCNQHVGETVDSWFTRLKTVADACNFSHLRDSLIRDQIVATCVSDKLRRRLLQESDIALSDALKVARAMEAAEEQATAIEGAGTNIAAVQRKPAYGERRQRVWPTGSDRRGAQGSSVLCYRCGERGHANCNAARGKACAICGKLNHLAKACRQKQQRAVHAISDRGANAPQETLYLEVEGDDSFTNDVFSVDSPEARLQHQKTAHTDLFIEDSPCRILVDSGASCNVLSERQFRNISNSPLRPAIRPIFSYGSKTPLSVMGIADLRIRTTDMETEAPFYITKTEAPPLLGRQTAFDMGVLHIRSTRLPNVVNTLGHTAPVPRLTPVFDESVGKDLPEHLRLETILEDFRDTFDGIGCVKNVEVEVQMRSDATPVCHPPSRVPLHLRESVMEELNELLRCGIIEQVQQPSAWVSRMVVVPKAAGGVRICQDLRDVNCFVVPEKQPIPTFEEITDEMAGSKFFSELDITKAFHQIPVNVNSRHLFTFSTPLGLMRLTRLSMGFTNASEILQRVMTGVLIGLQGVKWAHDDIVVFSSNIREHNERLRACLLRLRESGITLNAAKCKLAQPRIDFLGMRISSRGIQPATEKIRALQSFKEPGNQTELRSFLGLATYLARFVPNFADVTQPMRAALRKGHIWNWTNEQRSAFNCVKKAITSENILAFFSVKRTTEVIVDASPIGVGAILLQLDDAGQRLPVAFASRALTPTEQRYSQIEREALAVKFGCLRFDHYLSGSSDFTVVTDHRPLIPLFRPGSRPPPRIERMALRLQHLNLRLVYRPGPQNPADILSRQPVEKPSSGAGEKLDALYVSAIVQGATPNGVSIEAMRQEAQRDSVIQQALASLRSGQWCGQEREFRALACIKHELSEADGLLLRGQSIVVPSSLRRTMLRLAHTGHQCWEKTLARLRSKVWWRGMRSDCEAFVRACTSCAATSGRPPRPAPLRPTALPEGAWLLLGMDFYGPVQGQMLLVTTDLFSKFPEINYVTSTSCGSVLPHLRSLFSRYGIPLEIITDNGPPFNSAEFGSFLASFGVKHRRITPLHPQANGATERVNRCINKVIRAAIAEGRNWRHALEEWLRAYRVTPHTATGVAPAELLMGRRVNDAIPMLRPSHPVLHKRSELSKQHEGYTDRMAARFNESKRAKEVRIAPGTSVLRKRQQRTKLQTPFEVAPWTVVERRGDSYRLERGGHTCTRHLTHVMPLPAPALEATHEGAKGETKEEPAECIATTPHPRAAKDKAPISYRE